MLQLTFNPGLTLTGFRTTRPRRRFLFSSSLKSYVSTFNIIKILYLHRRALGRKFCKSNDIAKVDWHFIKVLRLDLFPFFQLLCNCSIVQKNNVELVRIIDGSFSPLTCENSRPSSLPAGVAKDGCFHRLSSLQTRPWFTKTKKWTNKD